METPPPFNPQPNFGAPARKKSSAGIIIAVIVGLVALCCLLLIGGGAAAWTKYGKGGMQLVGCTVGMSEVRSALLDYEAKNGKFPPADGWQDAIKPFYDKRVSTAKAKEQLGPISVWTADEDWVCSTEVPQTGIAYNTEVAGKKRKDLSDFTIIVFEVGTVGRNQHLPYVKRNLSSGPMMFGSHRHWIELPITGKYSQGGVTIDANDNSESSDDSSDDSSPKSDQPDKSDKSGKSDSTPKKGDASASKGDDTSSD